VNLFGCLSVCMHVCQTITFESLDVGSSYLHIWCIWVRVVYEGHRVKVKVIEKKKSKMRIPAM